MKIFLGAAALVLAVGYLPGGLVSPAPARIAGILGLLAPWRWDWTGLGLGLAHAAVLCLILYHAGRAAARIGGRGLWTGDPLFAFGLGLGAVGTAVLGLGLVGLLRNGLLLAMYGAAALAAASGLIRRLPAARDRQMGGSGRSVDTWVFITCAAWCGVFLLADLAAPEGFWDALVYHLGAPKQYLGSGKIAVISPMLANMPILQSMNYVVALAVRGETAARALNLATGAAVVAGVWRLASVLLGPGAGPLVAALALTSPVPGWMAVHAGADTATALFSVLAVLALARAWPDWPRCRPGRLSVAFGNSRGRPSASGLVMAGVFAGLAASSKLPGFAVLLIVSLLASPAGVSAVLRVAAPAVAVCAPWLIRAWMGTGNPVFPLLSGVFPSFLAGPWVREAYARDLGQYWGFFTLRDLPVPGLGAELPGGFRRGVIGPLPALAVLTALTGFAFVPGTRLVTVFVAALTGLWALTVPSFRFYGAGFVLLPLLLPWITGLRKTGRLGIPNVMRVVAIAVIIVQCCWFPVGLDNADRPWLAARRGAVRETYYAMLAPNSALDAVRVLERHAPPGPRSRILALGESRGFLLPPNSLVRSVFETDALVAWAREADTPGRLLARFRQAGVEFVLLNVPEVMRLAIWEDLGYEGRAPEKVLSGFFRRHAQLEYARSAGWIYRIGRRMEGAPVPECYRLARSPEEAKASACLTRARQATIAGETRKALANSYAAVAAGPESGLAWATLADALFTADRREAAVGAYSRALDFGWRTSTVYRNYGVMLAKLGKLDQAREAMEYAVRVDPESRQIRSDLGGLWNEMGRRFIPKIGEPVRGDGGAIPGDAQRIAPAPLAPGAGGTGVRPASPAQ